jgi:ubiquinone/menaquinone biosynthesis C-methylase UbiE
MIFKSGSMPDNKKNRIKMDLKGEERFGPVLSRLYTLFSRGGALGIYDFACKDILSKSGSFSLLDVGTGPGVLPKMLSERTGRISVWAVDPSESMLRIAIRNNKGRKAIFAIGYSQKLPFKRRFDMIISSVSFHHWAHKKESLAYLSTFLKPKGEIRIYELKKSNRLLSYFIDKHRMSMDELRHAADGTGLAVKEVVERDGFVRGTYVKRKKVSRNK